MTDLEKARQTINEIDKKMALLFEERMEVIKQVAEYKKNHGLQITDANREEIIINQNSKYIKNDDFKSYYINFLRSNIEIEREGFRGEMLARRQMPARPLHVISCRCRNGKGMCRISLENFALKICISTFLKSNILLLAAKEDT